MNLNIAATHPMVLVVDDEPLLRSFNADMLSEAGFEVLEAADADEALCLLEQIAGIEVVFTDVEMPGAIDGFALAERIGELWPRIGVIVTSGRRLPNDAFTVPTRCFLPKPYRGSHVIELIDSVRYSKH